MSQLHVQQVKKTLFAYDEFYYRVDFPLVNFLLPKYCIMSDIIQTFTYTLLGYLVADSSMNNRRHVDLQ